MSRKNIENVYPLSPLQEGMLFHTLYAEGEGAYVTQLDWAVRGSFDLDAFQRAFHKVVERHAILRTFFTWEGLDRPIQVVQKRAKLSVETHDLRGQTGAEQQERLRSFADEDRRRGFDLTRAPAMRVTVFRLGDELHRCMLTIHHIVIDGWSKAILVREVLTLYHAYAAGKDAELPKTTPYADFIAWLDKQDPAKAEGFFRNLLAGFTAPTPFGVDHPPEEATGEGFEDQVVSFSTEQSQEISAFCRTEGLTVNTLLQGVFAVLLSRYTGEEDVLFGATVSGRSAPIAGIDRMVGLFINAVPVRARLDPEQPVRAFLSALQVQQADIRELEHTPLVTVQGYSEVPRGTPLFEGLLVFENFPVEELVSDSGAREPGKEGGGKRPASMGDSRVREHSNYPLTLMAAMGRQLSVQVSFDRRRFEPQTIRALLDHVQNLVRNIVRAPGAPLRALSLLGDEERRMLVETWNKTDIAYPAEATLHGLFEAQAARNPEAPALLAGGEAVSYRALNEQANRLAHHLRSLGAGRDVPVGICVERSPSMVVALLAVLKSGACYVPIDPAYPEERISLMIEISRLPILVTQTNVRGKLPARQIEVVCLDEEGGPLAAAPSDNLGVAVDPWDIAYVMYTSGSTGIPKGVSGTHTGAINRFAWMWRTYPYQPGEVSSQKTTLSFVDSIWEIFGPLLAGVPALLIPDDVLKDTRRFIDALGEHRVTRLVLVPSLLRAMLDAYPDLDARLPLLKYWTTSGEALTADLCDRFLTELPDKLLLNLYGSTEVSADATYYVPEKGRFGARVPIGKPMDNTQVYLLDGRREPVPVGVVGELYVGGAGVARGYLHRPDLSAERFLPDPFRPGPKALLFKTGDLGRYRPDGNIDYLGRADYQVKVRGFRIELGEVESAVSQHPAVKQVVVTARDYGDGDLRILAYVVPAGAPPSSADLRLFVASRLPEYMVPSVFVVLDRLPLTPSGKVDRKALPLPERVAGAERVYVAPRGPTEEGLCGIFAEVLKIPAELVGAHDGFFELGGHSLLATQTISRIRGAFGVELPLRALFEAPTPAALGKRVDEAIRGAEGLALPPLVREEVEGPRPLSFAQERLWFLDQLTPGDTSYNIPLGMALGGALDLDALHRAFVELVRRHEALRTTFATVDNKPVQIIHPAMDIPLPVTSLTSFAEEKRMAHAQKIAAEEIARPFDLATGPLLRVRLIELAEGSYHLVLTIHHIVSDGWSMGILRREVSVLYDAFRKGMPSPLPELPAHYADYAAWQRGWLRGEVEEQQLGYWKQALGGAPQAIDLPADHPRPSAPTHRGGRKAFVLSTELSQKLHALSRKENVTLFMLLLAAYDVLLHRYTGQDDIVVGSPIAGRTAAATEAMIGFFVNTLVLRAQFPEDISFSSLLASVRESCLGAYAHQDVPFERLVRELAPERDMSRTPLFQVMFIHQNAPREEAVKESGGEPATANRRGMTVEDATAKFDLTLTTVEGKKGIVGYFEFALDLFEPATIERMAAHFVRLLEAIARAPGAPVSALPMLADDERSAILDDFNATDAAYPEHATLHGLFEEKAAKTPDAVALIFEGREIDYRTLNERSNRLAHHLRSLGAGKDTQVGICVERSPEMVIALIAVLKTGAAYVPLDPTYPRDRLALMIEISKLGILITQDRLRSELPTEGFTLLSLDDLDRGDGPLAHLPAENPGVAVDPWDIAYVMYTSGSTGAPKGVSGTHTGMVNRLSWMWNNYPFEQGEICCQKTTLSFGDSIWEIFGPLLQGVPAVLIPSEVLKDTRRFVDTLSTHGISRLVLVPSLLRAMLDTHEDLAQRLPRLRWWTTSGEALPAELCRRFLAAMPDRVLLNLYGCSEISADATCYVPDRHLPFGTRVPIGKPIQNVRVYVLDARREPVPIGVSGEIYIGGVGIARGYLHRPDLTAQRFLPDPFRPGPRALLFKTGDLGRHLPSGDLEYLGRADLQVKVRGFRIELGEVEGAIVQHPSVSQVVVAARDYGDADRRLIAYVVWGQGAPSAAQLRSFVKEQLPEYMVPSVFVFLDKLPLTPSGKVDRKALPAPERAGGVERAHVAPRGPTEEAIVAIFAEVLKISAEDIGVHDGFFELGGHSLLATQAMSRIRGALGVDLQVRVLFEAPSAAELGKRVDDLLRGGGSRQLPPLEHEAVEGPRPLSFAQERLWFLDQLAPGDTSYTIPLGMQLGGSVDRDALKGALTELCRRHEALRTVFVSVDGKPAQVIRPAEEVALPFTSLMGLPEGERFEAARKLSAGETNRPFDLEKGPLFRARLVELDHTVHLLLLTMHHIVSDGWSLGIIQREVAALYEAFRKDEPSPLPELPIQYADYAAWQRRWLDGDLLEEQLGYWKEALGGAPQALDLPGDRPRPAVPTYRGGRKAFALTPETSESLIALAQRENVTLFMLLCAAFEVLLHRITGQDDLVIGSPIAGRTAAATEGLVGFFVNTLVLRARFPEEVTFTSLLAQVRETCLGAYAHQDVPFERLVAELSPERDPSRTPLFQVMFLLQNVARESAGREGAGREGPSGARRGVTIESGVTKFDLTLMMTEGRKHIGGAFEFALDLFDAPTIDRLTESFVTLLDGIARSPSIPVGDLPILPAAEEALLVEWNATELDFPREACLHELVEAQADATPDAVALVDGHDRITYGELERQSNRLAHALRARGVGPDVLVGVCVRRSAAMVIALLATLKAGGAYVPLDPTYPTARLGQILEDAAARVVLTESAVESVLPEHEAARILLDRDAAALAAEPDARLPKLASSRDLAYVLFTSGSTGRPKGVAIEHHSAVCLITWAKSVYGPADRAGVLLATSICFDLSVFELFLPLSSGGKLIVAENALALPGLPAAGEVTLVNTVPTAIAELVRTGGIPASVRVVCLAGEPLAMSLVSQVYAQPTIERVYNLYGPTEDTTYSTFTLVPNGAPVTVGRPIGNGKAYILDARRRPVPIGVPGEIYLGGEGLARGYLGRPDLTAERFVPDPFHAGERLYRTSDLGRFRTDGEIEYLGRIDHQVKVRGFRIELGEVELVMLRHSTVKEAVAVAREDAPGNKRLVAYVVASEGAQIDVTALRAFVAERLPDFMVPQVFVALEKMPLTANGKIDRKALPAPELGDSLSRVYVAPRNPVEEALVGMFAAVLKIPAEQIGVHHGFFELGGHSLLATQVMAKIRTSFGVELLLRTMFEASSPAALARRVEDAIRGGTAPAHPPLVRVTEGPTRQLSFAQERLWFLDQLSPGDASYNMALSIQLLGALDREALRRAFAEIVQRHESLRTTFSLVDGKPLQVIHDDAELSFVEQSLARVTEGTRLLAAKREAAIEAAQPFDLERGPLVRARLLELDPEHHVLLLTMHHIVSDGWSMSILEREVAALYDAFRQGRPSPLRELPAQYSDYAAWQRAWLDGPVLDTQLGYWKEALRGAPHALDLPTDRPRPTLPTHRGQNRAFMLPHDLSEGLFALARKQNVTLFMLLLAAYDVLLHRYSGQDDILVGSPIAGRTVEATEGMIGFFVNTLVFRAQPLAEKSFTQLLGEVRETCLGAYTHQDVPFERLVRELSPERDTSRSPLFQVMFLMQNAPRETKVAATQTKKNLGADLGTAKFDLTLTMLEGEKHIGGYFELATDLFETATIDRMIVHFQNLLYSIVRNPGETVDALSMIDDGERLTLEVVWNQTGTDYPRDAAIEAIFERQVDRDPDATAAVFGEERLTYGELDRRANRLARLLRERGVTRGTPVGLFARRSLDMVVALLGILKAGGAYVPLDPEYPAARLAFLIEDAELAHVVAIDALPPEVVTPSLAVIAPRGEALDRQEDTRLPAEPGGDRLAYVMYTSGSTGKPKGVTVPHRAVVRLVKETHYARFDEDEVFLHLAPLSFDASTFEIWGPLLNRGRLVIFPAEKPSTERLGALIRDEGVTTLWLTAGLYNATIDSDPEVLAPLRQLLIGGEALSVPHVAKGLGVLTRTQIINGYGPTEGTTFTCCHPIGPDDVKTSVPIGRPIANTTCYVLDPERRLCPIGVPGELYVGGDGLALGYLRRPELTEERFVPNPFDHERSSRLYRTGDRVRTLGDGTIEYLGRIDQQVKIRGYRIEPGEIEAVLAQRDGVKEARVFPLDYGGGDKRLVAYLVADGQQAPSADDLRAYLRGLLPDFMVPSAFLFLDRFPLTPNGKIDRAALPTPESVGRREGEIVPPHDELEATLVMIWRKVLKLPEVSVRDSFFDLGGHSMLAVQMVAELKKQTGKTVPLIALFSARTIEQIAALVRDEAEARKWSALVPVRSEGSKRPFFMISRPNVNALGYMALGRHLDPDRPLYVLQYQYPEEYSLGRPYTREEYEEWTNKYIELMRSVQPEGPYLLGGMCEGALIAFSMARSLEAEGEKIALLAMLDAWPEENTRDPFLNDIVHYEGSIRRFIARVRGKSASYLFGQLKNAVVHFVKKRPTLLKSVKPVRAAAKAAAKAPADAPPPPSPTAQDIWLARHFPGPNFVPPKVNCDITVFRVKKQPYWRIRDERLGWGPRSNGEVTVHMIAGDHQTFMREEHVQTLVDKLEACIAEVEAKIPEHQRGKKR
ncbi:MAG: amino acid adenylation domain-containing protein [Byssovorax sp.]